MKLTDKFTFSQSSLQDFVDCKRRFELRYLEHLAWPAIETEPILAFERLTELGARFHRMIQQYHVGIPEETLTKTATEPDLALWWQNFLLHQPADLPEKKLVEVPLAVSIGGHRLLAKFDLIAVKPEERITIVDWKTSQKLPKRTNLANRMQTKVYPYVLVEASAHLNGGNRIEPEQVELVYWFANFPEEPIRFSYTSAAHARAGDELASLVEQIESVPDGEFRLTTDEKRCAYCTYRSLCERGTQAGQLSEIEAGWDEDDLLLDFDLDQIAEIEF